MAVLTGKSGGTRAEVNVSPIAGEV
jgi:hypothetical protein